MRHCRRKGCEQDLADHDFNYVTQRCNDHCIKCGMFIVGDVYEIQPVKPKTMWQKILELFK